MEGVLLNADGTIGVIPRGDRQGVLSALPRQVALAPGYTLRSFFRMLERHGTLVHLNAFFSDLLEQYRQGPAAGCRIGGIDWLVLDKTIEMVGFPGTPRLEIYRSFHGWGGGESVSIRQYPVDMLLDMEVRLGRLKHVVFGDQVDVFEFDTIFTLFEFVEGVGWELGFHGAPRECQIEPGRK